jgi:hypothetical protein
MATTNLFAGLNQETTQQSILTRLGLLGTDSNLAAILAKLPSTPATDTPHIGTGPASVIAGTTLTAGQTNVPAAAFLRELLNVHGTSGLLHTDSAALLAKLPSSPALDATVAAITTALNTGVPHTDSAAILSKLPASPALDASLQSILTKLSGDPANATNQASEITALNQMVTALGIGTNSLLKAEDAAVVSGAAGLASLFYRSLTTPTALTDNPGDYSMSMVDAEGKQVILQGAAPENTFQGSVQTTTAATTALKAAAGAGLRNYITDLEISIQTAVAQNITVLDGATVVARYALPATIGANMTLSRRTPLRGTANTAVSVTTSGAGTVNFNYSGYVGV